MFDSAGKYGAGLSLEVLGKILKELGADGDQIIVSNKLGWKRIPLDPLLKVPTFEGSPCIWKDIEHDAVQEISYDGVLSCFHQGNDLLGFVSEVVSIHDPEEYIAAGGDSKGRARCRQDILDAYRALFELKSKGVVKHIGIGSKSVEVVEDICRSVQLDWVMIACSYTIYRHPDATRSVLRRLHNEGVTIINAAVFHAGFLLGGDYFDYEKLMKPHLQRYLTGVVVSTLCAVNLMWLLFQRVYSSRFCFVATVFPVWLSILVRFNTFVSMSVLWHHSRGRM